MREDLAAIHLNSFKPIIYGMLNKHTQREKLLQTHLKHLRFFHVWMENMLMNVDLIDVQYFIIYVCIW